MTPRRHRIKVAVRSRNGQRGVALLAVMTAIAVCLVIASDFGTQSTLDTLAAANHRDTVRAHFLARSALDLSELIIRLQQRVDNIEQLKGIQITDFADMLMPAFCGSGDEFRDFLGMDAHDAKGLGVGAGASCGIKIATSDEEKINVNCALANGDVPKTLKARIEALYYFGAFDPIFEEEDAEGWRRTREVQSASIVDYADRDSGKFDSPGTGEDYGYENLRDPYKPKNNYLDTVGEIKLARGVDDRFWTLFGDAFTVYGGCKSNVSTLSNVNVIAMIIYLSVKENDPIKGKLDQLWMLASVVAKARELGFTFQKLADFADFVKDPVAAASSGLGIPGLPGQPPQQPSQQSNPFANLIPPGMKIGAELDQTKLGQIAKDGAHRVYRIEAWGEAIREAKDSDGNYLFPPVRRTMTAVWDTSPTPQNERTPASGSSQHLHGAWVFLREE